MPGGVRINPSGSVSVLVLDPIKIDALFSDIGQVKRSFGVVGDEVVEAAQARLVPGHGFVTGRLRDSVRSETKGYPATRTVVVRVLAGGLEAPYARYVHQGTAADGLGYIYPTSSPYFRTFEHRGRLYHRAKRVHGQRANPFLVEATRDVLALRGMLG
jgi:hypothetical protein